MRATFARLGLITALLASGPVSPAAAQESHLLLVVGLGGDVEYRTLFHGWALDIISTTVERFGVAEEHIVYLGERVADDPEVIDDRSTLENMSNALTSMAASAGPEDRILIVLIGHGTGQGQEVEFNLPGPDLTPGALDVMLMGFPTQMVGVVNTAPSSGPFVSALSGPNRVILTATRTAQERNETQFGAFFVEALRVDGTDLDKDGRVSLLEAFQYAKREVDRYYAGQNLLATEHAQLDDNGDGEGSQEVDEDASDGRLAATFWLGSSSATASAAEALDSITDPALIQLYGEKADLERRVVQLRALRGQMEEGQYELELEALLVELALKNREIREKGGGE